MESTCGRLEDDPEQGQPRRPDLVTVKMDFHLGCVGGVFAFPAIDFAGRWVSKHALLTNWILVVGVVAERRGQTNNDEIGVVAEDDFEQVDGPGRDLRIDRVSDRLPLRPQGAERPQRVVSERAVLGGTPCDFRVLIALVFRVVIVVLLLSSSTSFLGGDRVRDVEWEPLVEAVFREGVRRCREERACGRQLRRRTSAIGNIDTPLTLRIAFAKLVRGL